MIISRSVTDTLNIGKAIARHARSGDIVCLLGGLGSGKTVLAKGIAGGLGINKNKIISPTFVLIRQYQEGRLPLYHFDLYRLKDDHDILGLGYEEYLDGRGLVVIEWADRLKYLLPKEYLGVQLLVKGQRRRSMKFQALGKRYQVLLKEIYADIRH
jgi:tRNA threonylcarbamoyladenosine biosynthesis protein TsaE